MAYASLISLMNSIDRFLNSSHISISSPNILKIAFKEAKSLTRVLDRLDESRKRNQRLKDLEALIREAGYKLEDVLESHVSNQFLSQSEKGGCSSKFSLEPQELRQDIDCFAETVKKMKEKYITELDSVEEDGASVSVTTGFGGSTPNMAGSSDNFCELRDRIVGCFGTTVASIVGMAGIGKTTLAKKIFEDPLILRNFSSRFFVKVGPKSHAKEIQKAIASHVYPERLVEGDENLDRCFRRILRGSYLIVLDDVWDANTCNDFIDKLPDEDYGSVILVTTRLIHVSESINYKFACHIKTLNKEESWDLLRSKVFAENHCPFQLVRAGEKIAENCEGLPLFIVTVAELLSEHEQTLEYWTKIAADKEHPVFVAAYDQISEVLYPSYEYLPQRFKACFLYMGAFPQNYQVRCSRLINLWRAEGFLEPKKNDYLESFLEDCLGSLVSCNLVVVHPRAIPYHLKVFSLHSVFCHLCRREAASIKFLHTLNHYAYGFAQDIEHQRRLSIYKNTLFAIKDVYHAMASSSTARSLFSMGAYHQYQVPICLRSRLLRVLDALTIRIYEFPFEVLKLVQLRHLALTLSGNADLPPTISKIWNLQSLILNPHQSIKCTIDGSFLPVEIWELQELKYLQNMGRNLPEPPQGAVLPNLLTLLQVGAQSCTKGVLESVPKLEKLSVQIVVTPNAAQPLSCFDHLSHFRRLKSLKYVVVNPELKLGPPCVSIFPATLKKLSLSGMGYPWEEMGQIAALPNLEILKLRCFAFQGPKWEIKEKVFRSLTFLEIEDSDVVQWRVGEGSFPYLWFLTMKNCYNLQEIPEMLPLNEIQVVDCSSSAVSWAKQMESDHCRVYVDSSWDDTPKKPFFTNGIFRW